MLCFDFINSTVNFFFLVKILSIFNTYTGRGEKVLTV